MTSPVSGWYPDPSGLPGERFWNGTGWSNDTRPAQAAAGAPAPQAYDGFGQPAPTPPTTPTYGLTPPPYGTTPPPYGTTPPPYGTTPTPYGVTPPPYGSAPPQYGQSSPVKQPSLLARNSLSFATIGVTVAYVLILVFAHIAILGILPLLLGIRAVSRREQLAIPAVVIGVLAFVLGIYEYTR